MGANDRGLTPFEFALAGVEPPEDVESPSLEVLGAMRALAASVGDAPVTDPGLQRLLVEGASRSRPSVAPGIRPSRAATTGRSIGSGRAAAPGAFVDITPDDLQPDPPRSEDNLIEGVEMPPDLTEPAAAEIAPPLPPPSPTGTPIDLAPPPGVLERSEAGLPPLPPSEPELEEPSSVEIPPPASEPDLTQYLEVAALDTPFDASLDAGTGDREPFETEVELDRSDGPLVAGPLPPGPPTEPERPIPGEPNESLVAQVLAAQGADEAVGGLGGLDPTTTEPASGLVDPVGDPTPPDVEPPALPSTDDDTGALAPVSIDRTWSEIEQVRADLRALSLANDPADDEFDPPAVTTTDGGDDRPLVAIAAAPIAAATASAASTAGGPGPMPDPLDGRDAIPMTQVGPPPEQTRSGRRVRRLLFSSGALLVACLAVLGWWWWGQNRSADTGDALSTRTITESSDTTAPASGEAGGGDPSGAGGAGGTGDQEGTGSTSEFGTGAENEAGGDELSVSTSSTTSDGGATTTESAPTTTEPTTSTPPSSESTTQTSETTTTTEATTTTTTEPTTTTTTTPPLAYIGDRVSVDGYEGPGLAGVEVSLWEDTDRNGTGDRLVSSTTTGGDGRYFFDQPAGCYEVRFRPPNGYQIRGGLERQALCVNPGESAARMDAIADAEIRAAGPSGCRVERSGSSYYLGVEVYESAADWADSYTFYDSAGGVVARTSDMGQPDDIDNSGDYEWWGSANGFNHRSVWTVSAVRNGSESDPVTCERQSED